MYGELDFCTISKHPNKENILKNFTSNQKEQYLLWSRLADQINAQSKHSNITQSDSKTIVRPLPKKNNDWHPENATKHMEGTLKKAKGNAAGKIESVISSRKANFAIVSVYFATDRNHNIGATPNKRYGNERSNLTYGEVNVTVPRDHRMGELESPSILKLEFYEDPDKHVTLREVFTKSKDDYFKDLSERLNKSKKSNAFIFIHGYNVSFEDAAKRTAQISYDLAFDGIAAFYSWPSQGDTAKYLIDEQMIEWTQSNFKIFLDDFFKNTKAENIYLIAHSMGNRALTRSIINLLTEKPELAKRITEVILTAPDIDADVFKRDIAPPLIKAGRPITLYASSDDVALKASKKIHGANRAGDSGSGIIVVPGIETVDASGTDSSFIGHSYYAESRNVLSDLYNLISNGHRADTRFGLQKIESSTGNHWIFKR